MSSILKALKRLEEEKAEREAAAAGISGRVVKSGVVVPRPQSPWRLPLAMVGGAVVAVLVTYVAMGGFGPGRGPQERPPVAPQSQPLPAVSTAAAPVPTEPSQKTTPVLPARPSTELTTSRKFPAAVPEHRGTAPRMPSAAPPQEKVSPAVATPEPVPQPAPVPEPAAVPAEPSVPLLKVTGIAWQKDAAGRVAMVNGGAVTGGGKVSGARVEEILPDRVRFTFGGRSFDVFLGKSSADQ